MFCAYTRPRYQVSIYRTIGFLVLISYPPKVLVIPKKQWLRPNMTEKLFTGMLSIKKQNQSWLITLLQS